MPLDNRELTDLEKSSGGGDGGCGIFFGILTIIGIVISIIEFDFDDMLSQGKVVFWWLVIMLGGGLIFSGFGGLFNFSERKKEREKIKQNELKNNKSKEIKELLVTPKQIVIDDLWGKEGLYYYQKDDLPFTGKVIYYHENKEIRVEEFYKDGKIDGIRKTQNDEGKILSQTAYKNHILYTEKTWWNYYGKYLGVLHTENQYENGNLICEKRYSPNGKRNFIKLYQDGKLKNIRRYHSNDIIKLEEIYKNGKRDGIWRFWNEDGFLNGEAFYEKGKELETIISTNIIFKNNLAYHKKDNKPVTGYVLNLTGDYNESEDYIAYNNGIRYGFSRSYYCGDLTKSEYYKNGKVFLISKTLELQLIKKLQEKTIANTVYNLLLVLAYLRKSSRTFLVVNYLLNQLLKTRNKPYTNTLPTI